MIHDKNVLKKIDEITKLQVTQRKTRLKSLNLQHM
jgi:hypothetical protein